MQNHFCIKRLIRNYFILANSINAGLRRSNPEFFEGLQIHEIQPVKFNGSPTALPNKMFLTPFEHAQYTNFWNSLMRSAK